ncbi:DUF3613 domain-containing protein [Stenotrophomonas sp. SY1]|uniref:DUF3613 domain-containing protein n=1 Tax=Stenotrophomonas sp. SY1 TaxID=477235 RepID=UPI001E4FD083|nr:DUF3613 domain-containing protein [Stenotrophomonas sp. SY1]MCD9087419.1 DUF3613 domain-containing protein [Stenotrophomonas sp. SY1]
MNMPRRFTSALLPVLFGWAALASAQHSPLIERMADPPANTTTQTTSANQPSTVAVVNSNPTRAQIGDTTRALLQLQADGSRAGNALPMLGEAASRSYQRYLNSFDHPIPEYFEATLPSSEQGGGN